MMWAQLVKMRLQPGREEDFQRLDRQWVNEVGKGTASGWVKSMTFRGASNPQEWYELVLFESEEKARENEHGTRHTAIVQQMAALIDGEPEYVDLTPVKESQR